MAKRSEGRVALVTGGARGIGAATAERLAEDGAAVAICDLDLTGAEATAKRIGEQHGVATLAIQTNVARSEEVDRLVATTVDRLGSVDILVNNAGITRDNLIHKMTDEDWDAVAQVHLKGAFLCSRAAQREMVKRNWGRIVNLSSVSALGNRGQTNYSTAKAGLQGMARTLAVELGRYGITANAVAPGFIDSDMTRQTAIRLGRDPEEWKEERAREIPVRRAGVPRDVANLIAFLASDEASFISGQVIYIAGGPRG
ncbi:MAG: SDR family oxidoreductase [Alphaproteobacteria bacterium]|nr:SDR family oxidoreductase [Alphaproteobacteria bacterium]MBV9863123.1 SDR family oxidoreductase [Alphaproteobacteria bacterium]